MSKPFDWKTEAHDFEWEKEAKPAPIEVTDDELTDEERRANESHAGTAQQEALEQLGGRGASFVIGAAGGASLGFGDEIGGAAMAVGDKAKHGLRALGVMDEEERISDEIQQPGYLVTANGKTLDRKAPSFVPDSGRVDPTLAQSYRRNRDNLRQLDEDASANHGGYHLAGQLAGTLAVPMPKVAPAAKGAAFFARAGQHAKAALPVGVAMGVGASKGELLDGDVGRIGLDAAKGGALSALIGGPLGAGAEKAGFAVAEYLKNAAADKAFKAMNGNAKIVDKARSMGYRTEEEMRQLGRWALDNGLIPWSGDAAEIVRRTDALLDAIGPKIGKIVERADGSWALPSYNRAWSKAHEALEGNTAVADRVSGAAKDFVDDILIQQSKTPKSFEGMWRLKSSAQRGVNWSDKAPLAREVHRDAVQRFAKDFEEQIGDALGDKAKAELRNLNTNYSKGSDVLDFSADAARRAQQHKWKSHLANVLMLSASGGAAALTPEAGALTLGASAVAKGLNNPGLRSRADDLVAAQVERLMNSRYAPMLIQSAQKGGNSLAIQHYLLSSKDPEYRAVLNDKKED